jgi:hypothetical protein
VRRESGLFATLSTSRKSRGFSSFFVFIQAKAERRSLDQGLERLDGLSQINQLQLTDAVISSRGLQSLKKLPQLQSLTFSNRTPLGTASLLELGTLTELKSLKSLTFIGCGLSDDSLRA